MPVQTQLQQRRGTAASWTSTNPTLAAGEIGFETDTGKFKIGNGSTAWAALAYSAGATAVTYLFNATSGQTTFSGADANGLTLAYTVGAEQVYLNGVLQVRGSDYTATNGTSIVLASGALTSDVLNVIAYSAMTITDTYTQAQANALFIPDAIVDAKGDLIAATAADTPARLAVGADNYFLSAQSGEATGLKWAGAEIAYTPTWGASGTAPSLGNGTITGFYTRIGDVVSFRIKLVMGSTTTFGTGGYTFSLPISMSVTEKGVIGNGAVLDGGVAWYFGYTPVTVLVGFTDRFNLIRGDGSTVGQTVPFTFGNTDVIFAWGQYNV